MADRYQQFTKTPLGKFVVPKLGLPSPATLRRYQPGQPALEGPALLGAAPGGRLEKKVRDQLADAGITVVTTSGDRHAALVFDATGVTEPGRLREVYDFFHPVIRSVGPSGRVVILGTPPEQVEGRERIAQRALEGFVRSVGKELKRGATAQLVYVAEGAEDATESTLRFLLSAKSAFVDAQVIRIGAEGKTATAPTSWEKPSPARSRWSPARPAVSARRSPTYWPATARTSSPSTSPPRAATCRRSPTRSAARRCSSTSRRRARPRSSRST